MIIKLIWAQDSSGGIGINNKLPWHFSEDLQKFKSLTLNSTIVMGRKTWESLKIKPLPKRKNIVLSSKKNNAVECYKSIEELMNSLNNQSSFFVIGGAQIYKIFYPLAHELHISFINTTTPNINVFFPISISEIEKNFNEVLSEKLSDNVLYTKWMKNN